MDENKGVFHAGKLCSFVCLFVSGSEEVKLLSHVLFWLVPLILRAAQKIQKNQKTLLGLYLLVLNVMSKVLRGRHTFLFNRPSCIFLASISFTVLWTQLSILVSKSNLDKVLFCILNDTRQMRGRRKPPSLLILSGFSVTESQAHY